MKQSQKVKQKLETKESLSRNDNAYSNMMTTRVLQEDGITGKITGVHVKNKFVYIGKKENIMIASNVYCSQKFSSREKIHKIIKEDIDDNILRATYSVQYAPDINLEIKLDNGKSGHISFNFIYSEDKPFLKKLFKLSSNSFSNLNEEHIDIVYNPVSDNHGDIKIPNTDISTERQIYNNKLDKKSNSEIIDSWFKYRHIEDGYWKEVNIKNIYTDGNDISLLIETPTNETLFNISFSENKDSKFWDLVENVAHGDPMNLKGESVYIAPYSKGVGNQDFDYLVRDIEREWALATDKPSDSLIDKIKNKFNI